MDDLDLYELVAGIEILEQVELMDADASIDRRGHKAVNPFTGKLHYYSYFIIMNNVISGVVLGAFKHLPLKCVFGWNRL